MAEEVPEEISPPRLTAEDVEKGIALTREERENVTSLAEGVSALSPLMSGLREKFPDDYGEIFSYALSKIPRPFLDYWMSIAGTVGESGASPENSPRVRKVTDSILGADTVSGAKDALDSEIGKHAKIESYSNPVIDALSLPISAVTMGESRLPYLPNRVGIPSAVTMKTAYDVVDFIETDSAGIRPAKLREEPVGRGTVFGPRLHTDRPMTFEVSYTGEDATAGTVGIVLYRVLRFVRRRCALAAYWNRIWIPILLHYNREFDGNVRKAFRFFPDYQHILALRVLPLGWNLSECSVRKVR